MVQKIHTIGDPKEIADLFNLESLIDSDELKYLYFSSTDKEINYGSLLNLVRDLELNNIKTPSIAIKVKLQFILYRTLIVYINFTPTASTKKQN